ncbi:hypothetical protein [Streptomyces sp. t99]|uniref:hypothetical protein n=1 Tax=Streptomyces sp. t99 TaxID=1828172 RepID=UPI00117E4DF6|nr:hypothetical protein [Streptomyces sp. t99]
MSTAPDALTVHQLLGRIVYFHALFIGPEQRDDFPPRPGPPCCNHRAAPGRRSAAEVLTDSAWSALLEVAADLPAHHRPCPTPSETCCATCRVAAAAAAVAGGWATTEHRAFRHEQPAARLAQDCGSAAAVRVGRIFADQHNADCPALDRITAPAPQALPGPDTHPLTGELLALWADPAATTRNPVASWLNHCTGLDDVRRVLDSKRSTT